MHRFFRMHLSPDVAIRTLEAIDLEEKSRIAEGVALIAVIDARKDFLAAGYSCMRSYCMGRLHMSENKALRRIQVARAALKFPEVFECLADGRLSVATASVLSPRLQPESVAALLEQSAFRSRHEILCALKAPSLSAAEPSGAISNGSNVQDLFKSHAPGHAMSGSELCATPSCEASSLEHASSQAHVNNPRRGRVTPSMTGVHEVRLSITDEEHADLVRAQALLGHALPSGDPALVYARARKHYLAHLEKQRLGVKPGAATPGAAKGRSIPKSLRRLVWERDGGRCAFVGSSGHRCEEVARLEIDHITPVALGGDTTPENLRVLCRAHNQFEAERVLGKDRVQRGRNKARRGRGRVGVAREANAKRPEERDAARQARHDDLLAALRGLGFRSAEAQRGAALADTIPDASLDTCLRHALAELTRPIVMRGERVARSTA